MEKIKANRPSHGVLKKKNEQWTKTRRRGRKYRGPGYGVAKDKLLGQVMAFGQRKGSSGDGEKELDY